ncbi:hypothetical protein VPIG_00028 [Vibrio phage PWH3a-P1]|uniref:hypothetical protein n=1 Tax=Vibrio phage PWH3a-P1 TaxID=754058 RepID=UPI0002C15A81|nr:hypothetical protein VPIG_00028 [Vibrio phage PWH3a-P1]AGH31886.1 hypothetical protein VPIG_00028 [Vibrio phage PWH3a-P1]
MTHSLREGLSRSLQDLGSLVDVKVLSEVHSPILYVEIIVLSTLQDDTIASIIAKHLPIVTQTVGNSSGIATYCDGDVETILFTRFKHYGAYKLYTDNWTKQNTMNKFNLA